MFLHGSGVGILKLSQAGEFTFHRLRRGGGIQGLENLLGLLGFPHKVTREPSAVREATEHSPDCQAPGPVMGDQQEPSGCHEQHQQCGGATIFPLPPAQCLPLLTPPQQWPWRAGWALKPAELGSRLGHVSLPRETPSPDPICRTGPSPTPAPCPPLEGHQGSAPPSASGKDQCSQKLLPMFLSPSL